MSTPEPPRRVVLTRDGTGAWIVSVPSIRGCHTYAPSVSQATTRIREALVLWDADPRRIELDIRAEAALRQALVRVKRARRRAQEAEEQAQRAASEAVRDLTAAGYSRRDAATLLGVSHQRVQQLLDDG